MTPAALARIHAAAFTEARAWSEAEFAGLLGQPGTLLTHSDHAFVLGRITLDEAEVLTLACDPAHQRQGQAGRALALFAAQAKARGAASIFLEVAEDNTPARALYARAGFAQTGKRPGYYRTNDGRAVAALLLCRALTAPDPASSAQSGGV